MRSVLRWPELFARRTDHSMHQPHRHEHGDGSTAIGHLTAFATGNLAQVPTGMLAHVGSVDPLHVLRRGTWRLHPR
jgi:hypothetical protein